MFYKKDKTKFIITIISFLYFLVLLYTIFKYGDETLLGSLKDMDNDDVRYIRTAWTLLEKGVLSYRYVDTPTVYIMPGLPFVLAFFMWIFGRYSGIIAFRVFQALLQSIALFLTYRLGEKIFSKGVGIIAVIISIFYVSDLWVPNIILTEGISKFLTILLIYITVLALEKKTITLYAIGGVVWGLGVLFRPTIAPYPIIVLIMWIANKYSIREMIEYSILVIGVFVIIMSPWWIRNYITFREVIPFTKSSGNPMLQATYINYDQSINHTNYPVPKDEIELDRVEIETAKYRIREYGFKEPLKYIKWYFVDKTFILWKVPFYWKELYEVTARKAVKYHLSIIFLALGGIFTFMGNNRRNKAPYILIMLIIYMTLIHIPFYAFSRYSYTIMFSMIIFAAYYINYIIRLILK